MAERLIVVDKEKLFYEGVFDAQETINTLKQWLSDKRYLPIEMKHAESTRPEGKYIDMEWAPFFKFSDYAKSVFKIHIQFNEVKDVVVESDRKKQKLQEGKVLIIFSGILETDYEHRWETKPVFYFLRVVFEKYLYTPFLSGYERRVKEELMSLKDTLKAFLNLQRYRM